jgi:hypothetical protein
MPHDPSLFPRVQACRDDLQRDLANEAGALILPVFVASAILFGAIYVLVDDNRRHAPITTHNVDAH